MLRLTIYLVAMFQMPQLALSPMVNRLKTVVFPELPLATIQTAMVLSSLASLVASLTAASIVKTGRLRKKWVVVFGLCCLGAAGVLSTVLHSEFWHLCLLNILVGVATGCYLSTMTSVMIDQYPQNTVRGMTGVQTTFMEAGGIIISLVGGALISRIWYGGYLVMLVGIPLAILAVIHVPSYSSRDDSPRTGLHIPGWVIYYAVVMFIFQITYGVCGSNISVHLAAAGIDDPRVSGYATAIQMAGGGVAGLIFGKLSSKLGDGMISLAFLLMFVGYSMVNLFQHSLVLVFVGMFLIGASFSVNAPQCVVAISKRVDSRTSALPTAIIASLAPCVGGFLSPVVFTNVTEALYGSSTNARYQFTAFASLAMCVIFLVLTLRNVSGWKEK